MTKPGNKTKMTKEIYLKTYDQDCFGIKLEEVYHSNQLITEIYVNDDNDRSGTKEFHALSEALYQLIEENEERLVEIYKEQLKEIKEEDN